MYFSSESNAKGMNFEKMNVFEERRAEEIVYPNDVPKTIIMLFTSKLL